MDGLFTTLGRARGHARYLAARSLRLRRPTALGTLLLAASAVTVWATANTPPTITSLTASASVINEGQSITVTGAFTDPDVTDTHTLYIWWQGAKVPGGTYPDETAPEKVQLPAGQTSFQVTHTYPDDHPPTYLKVTVADHQLPLGSNDNADRRSDRDRKVLPIEIKNVAPSIVDSSVHLTKTPLGETVRVTIDGDWTDPGPDAGVVSVVSSDSGRITYCTRATHRFHCERDYRLPVPPLTSKVYAVHVKVGDGDGGQDTWDSSVRIP